MLTRRAKARILWAMAICLAACMLMTMGVLIYSVVSRTVTNEYAVRLQLSLNAALITEGIHVKAEDGYNELDDASYRMLGNYLVRNAVLALHGGDLEHPDRVELRVGQDALVIVPLDDAGNKAVVHFQTSGKSFRIRIRQDNLMEKIRRCTDAPHYYLTAEKTL